MDLHREAEEHLRTIRTLMERATVYRAISAPTAAIAGFLSIGCGLIPENRLIVAGGWGFKALWLTVLVVVLAANAWLIRRNALRRGDPFVSPAMRMALLAVAPHVLVALLATIVLPPSVLPPTWMLCYGFALLATQSFAPPIIALFGWIFLIYGLCNGLYDLCGNPGAGGFDQSDGPALIFTSPQHQMIGSFGVLHLIYAILAREVGGQRIAGAEGTT